MSFIHKNFKNFSVHLYTAPEKGYLVNSHIIETKNNLVIVDTQFWLKAPKKFSGSQKTLKSLLHK